MTEKNLSSRTKEIEAKDIQISFGAKEILKGVSLDVPQKSFIGIIGPNGSGKSTMLKCIYRTLTPNSGAVFIEGKGLPEMKPKESAKKLAVVAQHNYYNFEFSVTEVVLMGRSPHKKAMERDNAKDYEIVYDCLKQVGMEEFADRSFSTLSGGEQQRVILARALAQKTPCLVLDEPTNHLDITHQLQLLKIVKQLDITVISAIHDLNIAAAFCDKIYVMNEGQIIAGGPPKKILTVPFLREIYHVETEITYDSMGNMHILFLP
ncbi:MAG: ABC transporter ATP-binding protein [Muricoprocola sp.]